MFTSNKYDGKCRKCGVVVPARMGILTKGVNGYVITHDIGGCQPTVLNHHVSDGMSGAINEKS